MIYHEEECSDDTSSKDNNSVYFDSLNDINLINISLSNLYHDKDENTYFNDAETS